MDGRLLLLPGDGIGKDVADEALKILKKVEDLFGLEFTVERGVIGGEALDAYGVPMKDDLPDMCDRADAVFLGAIGGPKWDDNPPELRPEKALLALRKHLQVYINLRPVKVYPALAASSPLRPERLTGTDMLIVRELTGGLYFGKPQEIRTVNGKREAVDTMAYGEDEIRRIAVAAFEAARLRRKKVDSVDKANILATSQLWRAVVKETAGQYPDIELNHLLVDNCAMQILRDPSQFDVILTENTFGDILSDEAAMLAGSLGMLPSASLGGRGAMYEPVHGSAPDIVGQDIANPVAAIASVAMMLRHSFGQPDAADAVERAIEETLGQGFRTKDIWLGEGTLVGTTEMGGRIAGAIRQ